MMKAWVVYIEFKDGSVEGVVFSDKSDALAAYHLQDQGATLAVAWSETYGDTELEICIKEIEL